MAKRSRRPKYCGPHDPSGMAYVWWQGKQIYFKGAKYGERASWEAYEAFCRKHVDGLAPVVPLPDAASSSVATLVARYLQHAERRHKPAEYTHYERVGELLFESYATTPTVQFGPRKLQELRDQMVQIGWTRKHVNHQVSRVRRIFKWGVSKEIVKVDVYGALLTVEALREGETDAPEGREVGPVAWADVEAILPFLSPTLNAMVLIQHASGMRTDNLCRMRPADVRRSIAGELAPGGAEIWIYAPGEHKTAWRDRKLFIPLGPQSQALLQRFEGRPEDAFYFSPRESAGWYAAQRAARRTTPPVGKYVRRESRRLRERFDRFSYRQSLVRAMDKAKVDHWHPHQLRHTRGTEIRARFGMEAAQVWLGHAHLKATEVYAKRDLDKAIEIAKAIG